MYVFMGIARLEGKGGVSANACQMVWGTIIKRPTYAKKVPQSTHLTEGAGLRDIWEMHK